VGEEDDVSLRSLFALPAVASTRIARSAHDKSNSIGPKEGKDGMRKVKRWERTRDE
jgi:hypothetical protein